MSCIDLIDGIARRLMDVIEQQENTEPLPTPDYGWENHRFHSYKFRLAHVEIFNQDRFCVVHCCVFPHVTDPAPIYGFDVIAGENKITGVFMDLSPVADQPEPFLEIDVGRTRERPEWGDIFSPHWLACRPTKEEMQLIGDEAVRVLTQYLSTLGQIGNRATIIAGQNRYCQQQRQNEHTRKALVNLLGPAGADEFMNEILFPTID
jgi:phycocyanobilin:ferredoxin oxidoreductase